MHLSLSDWFCDLVHLSVSGGFCGVANPSVYAKVLEPDIHHLCKVGFFDLAYTCLCQVGFCDFTHLSV